jgi:capsular exopolysaccharide synthesis family protein
MNPTPSREAGQLPALQSPASTAMGMPLPAAPWIETSESKAGFDFVGFLHSLRRRWLLGMGLGVLLATAFAGLLWLLVPVKYDAFVQIRVRRAGEQMLRDKGTRMQNPQDYEIEKQTQAALLRSPFVINAALRQPGISQMPLVRDEPWFGERDNEVAWLERQLKVEFAPGSEILRLSMRERYPEDLKRLLNAVTDAYMKECVFAEQKDQREKLDKLRERHRSLQREISEKLESIAELAKTYGSTQSDSVKIRVEMGYRALASLDREMAEVDHLFFDAWDALTMHQQRMQASLSYRAPDFLIHDVLMQYPEYALLSTRLVEMEQAAQFSGQSRMSFGAGANMQAQIALLKQQMEQFRAEKKNEAEERLRMANNNDQQVMQQELEMLQSRVRTLDLRRNNVRARHDQLSNEMRQIGAMNADLTVKQSALASDEDMMNRINEEMETLELEMNSRPQIEVLERAIIPDESTLVMVYLQLIAAWFLTLIGTVLGVAVWDMQAKRINNSQEVVESGDIRVIGSLPGLSTRRAGGLLPMSSSSRRTIELSLTRSIDSIRTALLFAKRQQPYEAILVTSALGQEGKTTVASQLAVSFARSGRRTLLIDGDVRNPQQHVVLGMSAGKGLCDVLRSDATLDEVVQPTPAQGLWFLGVGHRDVHTDQYLASPVMGKVFQELRNRFDLIVVDSGPVLTSPDAMLLGQHVDTAVISVRRDVSRLPKINEACDRLRSVGVPIAGAVLNGAAADVRQSEMTMAESSATGSEPRLEKV